MEYKITKSFMRTVTRDFNSFKFQTSLEKTVEIANAEELAKENEKLFEQAKILTERDMERHHKEVFGE